MTFFELVDRHPIAMAVATFLFFIGAYDILMAWVVRRPRGRK